MTIYCAAVMHYSNLLLEECQLYVGMFHNWAGLLLMATASSICTTMEQNLMKCQLASCQPHRLVIIEAQGGGNEDYQFLV